MSDRAEAVERAARAILSLPDYTNRGGRGVAPGQTYGEAAGTTADEVLSEVTGDLWAWAALARAALRRARELEGRPPMREPSPSRPDDRSAFSTYEAKPDGTFGPV